MLERTFDQFIDRYQADAAIRSVLAVSGSNQISPLTNGFDLLLLIVCTEANQAETIHHYIKDIVRIQERRIDAARLETSILSGINRYIVQWVLQGEIVVDKDCYLTDFKQKLSDFPQLMREQKMLVEFSFFLRSYLQSKQYLHENQLLDSYANILEALTHWARIAIIEAGQHPEVTVWNQLRKINPGIHKLYEELTASTETVEQRVQLVLLACEFSVMSKMSSCCTLLLRILKSRTDPWAATELRNHPDLQDLPVDVNLLLRKMVARNLIKEVAVVDSIDLEGIQLHYAHC